MTDHSQYGEQEHILHVFDVLGIEKGHLVDLGAGDGVTMSNSRALLEKGWTGDLYDGDPKGAKDVEQLWITKSAVRDFGMKWHRCEFLNIDLDGNDYWILRMFFAHDVIGARLRPSLIVCEINPIFNERERRVMPYDADHVWQGDTAYGMSYAAAVDLGQKYGYTPIRLHAGINLFLLRNDHAQAHPELVQPITYVKKIDHKFNSRAEWIVLP